MKEFYNKDEIMKLEKYGLIIQTNETIKRIRELEDENEILRNKLDTYVYLDNKQCLQIKALEEENEKLNNQVENLVCVVGHNYREQIVKLQQQLKSQPKKICDEIIKMLPNFVSMNQYGIIKEQILEIQAKYENVSRETIDEEKDSD